MATYKLLQDIEAEDHILGPLSLRQFIYGLIAATCAYFCFLGFSRHAWPLIVVFAPIMFLTAFFAFPWGRDQPTEVWALAKVRFLIFPRRRVWSQDGKKELVTITVPKKVDPHYTDGLTRPEVESRLQALANTLDSRGWASKNAAYVGIPPASDRLIDPSSLARDVVETDERPQDDIMDEVNNQTAAAFNQMLADSDNNRRQQLINQMNAAKSGKTGSADEAQLSASLKARKSGPRPYRAHMQTVEPLSNQNKNGKNQARSATPEKQNKDDKIEESRRAAELAVLANNNDRNIASIAREANRKPGQDDSEVIISLHGN